MKMLYTLLALMMALNTNIAITEEEMIKVAEPVTETAIIKEVEEMNTTEQIPQFPKETAKVQTETTVKDVTTQEMSTIEEMEIVEPTEDVIPEIEKTLEEIYLEQGYIIVHERPQNEYEIYCPEGLTLDEWWEMNPPGDGAYDDWDDENNSPDII